MSSPFMFGVGRRRLTAHEITTCERVAREHDAWFICGDFPGEGFKSWFGKRNEGEPFDGATARAVLRDVAAAGIELDGGVSLIVRLEALETAARYACTHEERERLEAEWKRLQAVVDGKVGAP